MYGLAHGKTLGVCDLTTKERELSESLTRAEKPVACAITRSELMVLARTMRNPDEFKQVILRHLRNAGCKAVESGPSGLRLSRGKLTKVKRGVVAPDPNSITYLWLPDAYVLGMQQFGGIGEDCSLPAHLIVNK